MKIFLCFEIYFLGGNEGQEQRLNTGVLHFVQDDDEEQEQGQKQRQRQKQKQKQNTEILSEAQNDDGPTWVCLDGYGFGAVPGRGEFAEAGYGGGDNFESFIDLVCGGEAREGEADAGAGSGRGEAHGGEDVGGFGGAGLAGGASADG